MKRTMFLTVSAVAIATLAAVSFTALAHSTQMGPFGGGHYMMAGMMGGHGPMHQSQQIKQVSFDELQAKLNLTEEQLPLWQDYVKTATEVQDNMQAHYESMDPQTMHEMSFEDRQTYMQSIWEERSEDVKSLHGVYDKLYASLTPEQQKIIGSVQNYDGMPCGSGWFGQMHSSFMGGHGYPMGNNR